jgi:hypothetical protein
MNDNTCMPLKSSKEELLGELESIKGLLDESTEELIFSQPQPSIDIPVLSDVISSEQSSGDVSQWQVSSEPTSSELNLDSMSDQELNAILDTELDLTDLDQHIDIPHFTLLAASEEEQAYNEHQEEHSQTLTTELTATPEHTAPKNIHFETNFDLEFIIQEIVDESIPLIESQLRERLSACSPEMINQLAKKYVHQ